MPGGHQFSDATTHNFFRIGAITTTAERMHAVSFPQIIGKLLIGGALTFGAFSQKN